MPVIRNNIIATEHDVTVNYYEGGGLIVECDMCDIISKELPTPVSIGTLNDIADRHGKLVKSATSCTVPGHPEGRVDWVNGTFYCAGCESTHDIEVS